MKRVIKVGVGVIIMMVATIGMAQKIDEARMTRDIAVAENILNTLIKQEFDKRSFFPIEVKGTYQAGYGVVFTVPTEIISTMAWGMGGNRDVMVLDGQPGAFTFSWSPETETIRGDVERELRQAEAEMERSRREIERSKSEIDRSKKEIGRSEKEAVRAQAVPQAPRSPGIASRAKTSTINSDSIRMVANEKIIQAAKNFIADYGDMISQLAPEERIVITNKGNGQFRFYGQSTKRSLLSVEVLKADVAQLKQGKLTRTQFLNKVMVTNTTSTGKTEPDIELLTSIFSRLYRSDLSTTFFVEGGTYYDRLTDFGAVIYMQVYSSSQIDVGLYSMPTLNLREVDQATRDKKVKEMYPQFEAELKENILEYGRTVKSLGDNEQLVFNVKLTKCAGCGIPADVEISVKNSVLKEYNSGKLDKNTALSKVNVKRGSNQ
jgi:hypothetical protein